MKVLGNLVILVFVLALGTGGNAHAAKLKPLSQFPTFGSVLSVEYGDIYENEGLTRVISRLASVFPELPVEIERKVRRAQPVFIFIPGILGSRLSSSECGILWGVAVGNKCGLKYTPNQEIYADLLDEYKFLLSAFGKDIYGEFFYQVDLMNTGNVKHLLYFAYDWRQDNRVSAQKFHEMLNSDEWSAILKDRKVVIVAHSMGGLVASYWYHYYFANPDVRYRFEIDEFFFLGTPHIGALSALVTLIEGYSRSQTSPWMIRKIESNTVFARLKRAGHTFPSIYQLLPVYSAELIDLIDGDDVIDHPPIFDIGTWRKFDWLVNSRGRTAADAFYPTIKDMLEDGLQFHKDLNEKGPVPNATYFFADNQETVTKVIVKAKSNRTFDTTYTTTKNGGDGRVPTDVAKHWNRVPNPKFHRKLRATHGNLPKANDFIDYIRSLRRGAMQRTRAALAVIANQNRRVLQSFVDERVILELPLNQMDLGKPGGQAVVEADRLIIAGIQRKDRTALAPDAWAYKFAKQTKSTSQRIALYALTVALSKSPTQTHFAARNLAFSLWQQGNLELAKPFAELAAKTPPTNMKAEAIRKELGSAYNTLGAIEWKLNAKATAKRYFYDAYMDYGNALALENLNKLDFPVTPPHKLKFPVPPPYG